MKPRRKGMGRLFLVMIMVGNLAVLGLGMAMWFWPPEIVHKIQAVFLVSSMAGLWFYDIGLRQKIKELDS
jgi:hypothetical protein